MRKLIYADEALKRINEIMPKRTDSDYKKGIAVGISMAKIVINEQEGADAVPVVHGHWERIPNTPTWKCSICGYEITGFIDRDGLTPMDCKVNCCSRCEAKMDEVTE